MSFIGARRTRISALVHEETLTPCELHQRLHDIQTLLENAAAMAAFEQAEELCIAVPYDVRVLTLCAECAAGSNQHAKAVQYYDRLLFQQDTAEVWAGKAKSLAAIDHYDLASDAYARAFALSGMDSYKVEEADALIKAGRLDDANHCLLGCKPITKARAKHQLAQAQILGETGQSQASFEMALRACQEKPTAQSIALVKQYAPDDAAVLGLCASLQGKQLSAAAMAELALHNPASFSEAALGQLHSLANDPVTAQAADAHLALFRFFDAKAEEFLALGHLRKYHGLLKQGRRHEDAALFTLLTRLDIGSLPRSKSRLLPVFVTGLPGSGRQKAAKLLGQAAGGAPARPLSLVEPIMNRLVRKLRGNNRLEVNREDLLDLQSELRDGLQYAAGNDDVVIDSSALNFRWSGLIAAALPEARIAHIKNDNVSTGWAIHRGGWRHPALKCQHSLGQIGAFQWRSAVLMQRWEQAFPKAILSFSGDMLSKANVGAIKTLVRGCDLEWSQHCIPPESHDPQDWHRYASYLNALRIPQSILGPKSVDREPSLEFGPAEVN